MLPNPVRHDVNVAEVVAAPDALAPSVAAWDALAVARGRPFCAPGWLLPWWREHAEPARSLRVVLVRDRDGEMLGVGPFYAQTGSFGLTEYRLLAGDFCHRVSPIAREGSEALVAGAIARALAMADPKPTSVAFEGISLDDPWPDLIAAAWPGRRRPSLRTESVLNAPAIDLDGGYAAWLARRERKFRKESRRTARRLEEQGVRTRTAHDEEAIDELLRLHHARWEDRGGSTVTAEARNVLIAAARELGEAGRLTVVLLEDGSRPIAAELVLRAGDELAFWSGGFDPEWARHAPGTQALLTALELASEDGVRHADLGGGEQPYKRRLADADWPIAWRTLVPFGPRSPVVRARLLPRRAVGRARLAARDLPEERQEQLRDVMRRLRAAGRQLREVADRLRDATRRQRGIR